MIRDHLLAFDDYVPSHTAVYTSAKFERRFGIYDTFALQAIVDDKTATGSGTLDVHTEHSGNRENWLTQNNVITTTIGSSGTSSPWGGAGGLPPNLPYVRFRITLGGLLAAAHVKLYVIIRDRSG